ncbi:MAG: sulfate ABC transporter substrate-binding protein [Pseudomonadota bacterium]
MDLRRRHVLAAGLALAAGSCSARGAHLLNVSYDPTRELYAEINRVFLAQWLSAHQGKSLSVQMSNGGSGRQARAVIAGLKADVVTLATAYDIDQIAKAGLIANDWRGRLPFRSTPFASTIVFLVRAGNPKAIHDWSDLAREGVAIVTPNPKTSGGARWNYLAAWAYALAQPGGNEARARAFVSAIFKNVAILDTGARGASTTFVDRNIGDVLIAWENEAMLAVQAAGADKFEIITPSMSILAEPPVAWVDHNVQAARSSEAAEAYLRFLFTPEAQAIGAKHFYRPNDPAVLVQHNEFAAIPLATIDDIFGGWTEAQHKHFSEGAIFDQISAERGQ